MQQPAADDRPSKTLTENQAALEMWTYYRDNKAQLSHEVRNFREVILDELMQGAPAAQVFARFVNEPEPPAPVRRTRGAH
jgi:hypothetical protein